MSWLDIKAKIEADNRFTVEIEGATFHMRLPSEHAWADALARCTTDPAAHRALVSISLTAWDAVKGEHFLSGVGDEAVPFSPEVRTELLDARNDIQSDLLVRLVEFRTKKREDREAARKN